MPSKYEPQDLLRDRLKANRVMSLDDMDRAKVIRSEPVAAKAIDVPASRICASAVFWD